MSEVLKLVHLLVPSERRRELIRALEQAADSFVREPGTLSWLTYEDPLDPEVIIIVESFRDPEAVTRHDSSLATATLIAELEGLLTVEPSVQVLHPTPRKEQL